MTKFGENSQQICLQISTDSQNVSNLAYLNARDYF